MNTQNNTQINVGIDTSQSQLDIYVRPSGHYTSYPNTPLGVKAAVRELRAIQPDRITIESTGRLEFLFVEAAPNSPSPFAILATFATSLNQWDEPPKPTSLMP